MSSGRNRWCNGVRATGIYMRRDDQFVVGADPADREGPDPNRR
jgi:hypothetical protein